MMKQLNSWKDTFFKNWSLLLNLALILLVGGLLFGQNKPVAPLPKPITILTPTPLERWLVRLADHENCQAQIVKDEWVGTMDSGSYSYGPFCFKRETYLSFENRYGLLPQAETEEKMNLIGDYDFTFQLAKRMLLERYNNWTHWRTSAGKIGLPPKETQSEDF